jgi:aminopeptidase
LDCIEKGVLMDSEFEINLGKFADVIVGVGLNLQPGQRLLMEGPKLELAPLVRKISENAYKAGARFVDVMWSDEELTLIRFQNAPRDSFEELSDWWVKGVFDVANAGDAIIRFGGGDPDLLIDQDPTAIATVGRSYAAQSKPFLELQSKSSMNWVRISPPIGSWSKKVFPELGFEEGMSKFWELIFEICRINEDDPVSAWKEHIQRLRARCEYLNQKKYTALKFNAPETDLTIGLPNGHHWIGGKSTSKSGIEFVANIPTEEILTLPHRSKVDGYVTSTRPVNAGGVLVEDINLVFSEGKVITATASKGEEVLIKGMQIDEGSNRLGEVALVPHSSLISQLDLLFYNVLLDENASNHLALGNAYKFCMTDGELMSDEEFNNIGGNVSNLHVDFMIGSEEMDVDGITADNFAEPVMRDGEWAFDV